MAGMNEKMQDERGPRIYLSIFGALACLAQLGAFGKVLYDLFPSLHHFLANLENMSEPVLQEVKREFLPAIVFTFVEFVVAMTTLVMAVLLLLSRSRHCAAGCQVLFGFVGYVYLIAKWVATLFFVVIVLPRVPTEGNNELTNLTVVGRKVLFPQLACCRLVLPNSATVLGGLVGDTVKGAFEILSGRAGVPECMSGYFADLQEMLIRIALGHQPEIQNVYALAGGLAILMLLGLCGVVYRSFACCCRDKRTTQGRRGGFEEQERLLHNDEFRFQPQHAQRNHYYGASV